MIDSVPLAELCDVAAPIMYGILQPGPDIADGVPYVRPTEIVDHQIDVAALRRTTPAIAGQYERASLQEGDVLLSIVGTIGKTAIVPVALRGGNITQSSVRIRADRRVAEPRYLQYALRSPQLRVQFDAARLGTGVPRLNVGDVRELKIPYVGLAQQRRVVAALDAAFTRINGARTFVADASDGLAELRQSLLAAAFRGDLTAHWREKKTDVEPASILLDRIRKERRQKWEEAELAKMQAKGRVPSDDRWKQKYLEPSRSDRFSLPVIPETWCWTTLEALTDASRVIRYGMLMPGQSVLGGRPYVKVMHMRGDVIDTTDLPTTTEEMWNAFAAAALTKGDLLLSIRGTYGRVALVPDELDGANITQDSARIAPLPHVDRHFLAAVLRSPYIQAYFNAVAKGVAVKGVNIQDVRPTPVPLPPYEEQIAISDIIRASVSRVDAVVGSVETTGTNLDALESAILAKAFRGELVPQDPNDEPASVLLERIRAQRAATEGDAKRQRRTKTRGREIKTEPEPAAIAETTAPHVPIRRHVAAAEQPAPRLTIVEVPLEDLLPAIRRVLATGPRDRDALIRDVARELGFVRTGMRVRAAIDSAINTASRRLIIRSERGEFTLYSPSIEAYGKEELKTLFLAALGSTWWDREDAIRATARYLGFKRTGETIDDRLRSIINGIIRQQRLEADGSMIRKV